MLTHTFCGLKGLSLEAEKNLWHRGCLSWNHFPIVAHGLLSVRKEEHVISQIREASIALNAGVTDYFLERLPPGYRLRILPVLRKGIAFMDIETTGLESDAETTVIGVWMEETGLRQFVLGADLEQFIRTWAEIRVLVTFNGIRFDTPMICKTFGLKCAPPQIDLMHELKAHGYVGGLKAIEERLEITRRENEQGDGAYAAALWQQYTAGNTEALQRLLSYNRRDVLSLVELSSVLWHRACSGFPMALSQRWNPIFDN